jgi:hypothetical protein
MRDNEKAKVFGDPDLTFESDRPLRAEDIVRLKKALDQADYPCPPPLGVRTIWCRIIVRDLPWWRRLLRWLGL